MQHHFLHKSQRCLRQKKQWPFTPLSVAENTTDSFAAEKVEPLSAEAATHIAAEKVSPFMKEGGGGAVHGGLMVDVCIRRGSATHNG